MFFEREKKWNDILRPGSHAGDGRYGNHRFNFGVQFRVHDHANKEYCRTERMSDVGQRRLLRSVQNVIDRGRHVVVAHFVPPVGDQQQCNHVFRPPSQYNDAREIPVTILFRVKIDVRPGVLVASAVGQPNVVASIGQLERCVFSPRAQFVLIVAAPNCNSIITKGQ